MNNIVIKGRLTRDVELLKSAGGMEYAKFTVAVNRNYDRENTDFFDCTAFGKTANFISGYFGKGQEILIHGQMQCEKWKDRDGNNRYSWNLMVREVEFCGGRAAENVQRTPNIQSDEINAQNGDFEADSTDELPF